MPNLLETDDSLRPTSTNQSLKEAESGDIVSDTPSCAPMGAVSTKNGPFSARPRRRRKSSFFRPSAYYDSSSIKSGKNIEMLPLVVLSAIFTHLNTADLLNLCVASRLLYLPAVTLLYHRIIVVQQYHPDVNLVKIAPEVLKSLLTYHATVIPYQNLPKLTKVLQNSKLSRNVNSIVFLYNVDHDLTKQIQSDFYSCHVDALLGLNGQKQLNLDLKEFVFPNMTFSTLNKLTFRNLRKLSLKIHKDNTGTHLRLPTMPHLHHLQILYENAAENGPQMAHLAANLIDSNIIHQLTCLEFKDFEELALYSRPHLRNNRDANQQLALWIEFFKTVAARRIGKLNVAKLTIDGFIGGEGVNIARLLSGVLDLAKLTEIDFRVKEFSHFSDNHHDNSVSLLLNVACMCKSVTHITSTPTHDCLKCQYNMLLTTLMLRNNDLEHLDLTFEFLNPSVTKDLIQNVVKFQKNLKVLILNDKSNQFSAHQSLSTSIPEYGLFEETSYKAMVFKGAYQLPFSSWLTIYKTLHNEFYAKNSSQLSDYVHRYFRDHGFSYRDFPSLEVFMANDIRMMVKGGHLVFLNHHKTAVGTAEGH